MTSVHRPALETSVVLKIFSCRSWCRGNQQLWFFLALKRYWKHEEFRDSSSRRLFSEEEFGWFHLGSKSTWAKYKDGLLFCNVEHPQITPVVHQTHKKVAFAAFAANVYFLIVTIGGQGSFSGWLNSYCWISSFLKVLDIESTSVV